MELILVDTGESDVACRADNVEVMAYSGGNLSLIDTKDKNEVMLTATQYEQLLAAVQVESSVVKLVVNGD